MFFPPCFRADSEITIWGPSSPEASLEDRIARYISAPLSPVEVRELPCSVSFRDAPATEWELGGGDDPRRGGHPPRADARLPDHRRRHDARLHPRPRAGARRAARRPRAGVDLGLRPRPRRRPADPRLPVHRRGVPGRTSAGATRRSPTRSPSPTASRRERLLLFHHDPLHTDEFLDGLDEHAPRTAGRELGGDAAAARAGMRGRRVRGRAERDCPACPRLSRGRIRPPVQALGPRSFDSGISNCPVAAYLRSRFLEPRPPGEARRSPFGSSRRGGGSNR